MATYIYARLSGSKRTADAISHWMLAMGFTGSVPMHCACTACEEARRVPTTPREKMLAWQKKVSPSPSFGRPQFHIPKMVPSVDMDIRGWMRTSGNSIDIVFRCEKNHIKWIDIASGMRCGAQAVPHPYLNQIIEKMGGAYVGGGVTTSSCAPQGWNL